MSQSQLSVVSVHGRPNSPWSVNYISANTNVWSDPKRQPPTSVAPFGVTDDAVSPLTCPTTPDPALPTEGGGRSKFKDKAEKMVVSAKKGFKMVAAFVTPGNSKAANSATSLQALKRAGSQLSLHPRQSVFETSHNLASTPSICLTKPTFRGSNVRLSIHQPGSAADVSNELDNLESDNDDGKHKSMRFTHPVVSGIIARPNTSGQESIDSEFASVPPGTPTTIATLEFEHQVNPKLMFRHSRAVSDGETFDEFKDVIDGVGAKTRPSPAQRPPTLPYITISPAIQLDGDEDHASVRSVTPKTEEPVLPVARESSTVKLADVALPSSLKIQSPTVALPSSLKIQPPADDLPSSLTIPRPEVALPSSLKTQSAALALPDSLTIGSGVSPSRPRTPNTRRHTTSELTPGAANLPYIPFHPSFNPFDRSPPPTASPPPAINSPKPFVDERAAAFAEVAAAEQLVSSKRHTTFYEETEAGLVPPPLRVPLAKQTKRKAVPSPASDAASSNPDTCKPLPPVPAPGSPRRYTRGYVPAALPMNDNGYPMFESSSRREQREQREESEKAKKVKSAKGSMSQRAGEFFRKRVLRNVSGEKR